MHRVLGYSDEIEKVANDIQTSVEMSFQDDYSSYPYFNQQLTTQLVHSFEFTPALLSYHGQLDTQCSIVNAASEGTRGIIDVDQTFASHNLQIIPAHLYENTVMTASVLEATLPSFVSKKMSLLKP